MHKLMEHSDAQIVGVGCANWWSKSSICFHSDFVSKILSYEVCSIKKQGAFTYQLDNFHFVNDILRVELIEVGGSKETFLWF